MTTYDPKVYELAVHFLKDNPIDSDRFRHQLAAHIQLEIEAWITFEEEEEALRELVK
jgi:hypothetical protein